MSNAHIPAIVRIIFFATANICRVMAAPPWPRFDIMRRKWIYFFKLNTKLLHKDNRVAVVTADLLPLSWPIDRSHFLPYLAKAVKFGGRKCQNFLRFYWSKDPQLWNPRILLAAIPRILKRPKFQPIGFEHSLTDILGRNGGDTQICTCTHTGTAFWTGMRSPWGYV